MLKILISLFKPAVSADKATLDSFRRKLIGYSNFSDNTFAQLIEPLLPIVAKHELYNKVDDLLSAVAGDEGFHKAGKKQAFFIAFCLILSVELVKKNDPSYVPCDVNVYPEILTVAIFHTLISHSPEGYKWISNSRALLKDAWLYLKSGRGRFADVMPIPHDENNECHSDSEDIDVDEEFTEDTHIEIGSLLLNDAPALSDADVLNMFGADDSDGPEVHNEKQTTTDDEADSTQTSEPNLLDISSLLSKK